jgi:Ca2+-binding RTX toxin-like protein
MEGFMIESLESRRLLAASVGIDGGGKLTIQGGSKAFNDIVVRETSAGTVSYELRYGDDVNVPIGVFSGTLAGVTSVVINARNNGSNVNFIGQTINSQIQGGSGVDYITVNDSGTGSSKITAGKGNDVINLVRANKSFIDAGDGDDQIYLNSAARPVYNSDTGMFESPDQSVTIALSAELVTVKAGGGNDVIIVYDGKVTLDGGGGSDQLLNESLGYATVSSTNVESSVVANPPI